MFVKRRKKVQHTCMHKKDDISLQTPRDQKGSKVG